MFRGRTFLLAGGGGSLGKALIEKLLLTQCRTIRVLDVSERSLYEAKQQFNDPRLRWLQGDIRNPDRAMMAMNDVDYVIALAALKSVDIAEANILECIETNICGTLIREAFRERPKKFLALSSDKASLGPGAGVYHATKFLLEKLILWANKHSSYTKFSCVRPANFVPSEMSFMEPWFKAHREGKRIPVTSSEASRYFMPLNRAASYTLRALQIMRGGEIFVPPATKLNLLTLARRTGSKVKIVGLRPGDRLTETLMSPAERARAVKKGRMWVIHS